jgi:hypothetical protein
LRRDERLIFGCEQVFSNDDAIQESKRIENVRRRLTMVANPSLDSSSISSQSTIDEAGASLAAQQILDEEDISEEMLNNKDPHKDPMRQGIALGAKSNGNFMGMIELPNFAVWTLELQVVKRVPDREEGQGDPADWVTIKFGTSLKNCSEVKVVRNIQDQETGQIIVEIKHTMRCKDLAYKFEFASSSENPDEHFVVQQGYFYQKSMEPLEIVDLDTGRVLSDYVKSIRLEEKQGKLRSTNLITELIGAEENDGEFWDSGALFGVFSASQGVSKTSNRAGIARNGMTVGERGSRANQGYSSRYPKDVFIALVKEEVRRDKYDDVATEGQRRRHLH